MISLNSDSSGHFFFASVIMVSVFSIMSDCVRIF
jgi:hypothetical protein